MTRTADSSEEAEDDHGTGPYGYELAEARKVVLGILPIFQFKPARVVGPPPQGKHVLRGTYGGGDADPNSTGEVK